MYTFPYYKEPDTEVVRNFIKDHPFAFLTGCDAQQRPVVTQIPVFIDEKDGNILLSGHMMKNTDHHLAFTKNPNALAVFTGPHTYVSASWYEDKQQASTWNYMSVHARGTLRFTDEQALLDILQRTTDHFENNPHSGSNYKDLPQSYLDKLIKAIIAFEIQVEKLDHVFKLSQNRDEKSYDHIAQQLHEQGGDGAEIGKIMQQRKSKVFGGGL